MPGRPIVLPGGRATNPALAALFTGGAIWLIARPGSGGALALTALAALGFGVTMVMPIGGADMPVVISLLNAFTGTAVAMAGFVLDNTTLIIAGALVGANDVTNPAARRAGNAVSGMPILDVDRAKSVVVIKRSMGHGYAGIDNELSTDRSQDRNAVQRRQEGSGRPRRRGEGGRRCLIA